MGPSESIGSAPTGLRRVLAEQHLGIAVVLEYALILAVWYPHGMLHVTSLVVVTACFLGCVFLLALSRPAGAPGRASLVVAGLLCASAVAFLLTHEPLLCADSPRHFAQHVLPLLAVGLLAFGWWTRDRGRARLLLIAACVTYAAFLATHLARSPSPIMDVWHIETQATKALLNGQNPYALVYADVYEAAGWPGYGYAMRFIYLPGLLLHLAPAVWLGLDIRWVSVLALSGGLFLFAHCVRRCSPEGGFSPWGTVAAAAVVIFWFQPGQPFLLEQAWPEALILLYACLAFWGWTEHPVLAGTALALALSLKQTSWFLLPFLGALAVRERRWRMMGTVAVGVACVLAPFFLWSPHDFVHNVVVDILKKAPRGDALSWNPLLPGGAGTALPWTSAVSFVAYGIGWLCLVVGLRRSADRDGDRPLETLKWTIVSLFGFFLFLKQSFFNYYYLVGGFLALYVCLAGRAQAARYMARMRSMALLRRVSAGESSPKNSAVHGPS